MDRYDEIARVAYEIFLNEGCCHGNDLGHWFMAEQVVISRYASPMKKEPGKEKHPDKKTAPEPAVNKRVVRKKAEASAPKTETRAKAKPARKASTRKKKAD